jgi:pilus assembly protein CpaB
MRLSRVAVLGVALVAGIIAAFLALNLSSTPPAQPQQPSVASIDTVDVLVATKDIPMGATVADDSVTWQNWPKTAASTNFIVRDSNPEGMTKVVGALARSTFYAGEPISEGKLIRSDRGFMSAILPAGKRAVATKIAADTSAGGFILPNDRVDVIMTRQAPTPPGAAPGSGSAPQYLTETILNNVRVLAIDQTIQEKNGEKVVVGQTATLELTPQQAQILTVAQQMSERLTLALRSIADAQSQPAEASGDAYHLIGGTKQNGSITVVKNGVAREVSSMR